MDTHLVVWFEEKVTVYNAAGQTAKGTKTNPRVEGHREGQAGYRVLDKNLMENSKKIETVLKRVKGQ